MTEIKNDVAQMQESAGHVDAVKDQLQQLIAGVRNRCEDSRASWEGSAQAAFQKLMTDYDEASRKLQDALTETADRIRANGKGYDAAEQENQQRLQGIDAGGSSLLNMPA